MVSCGMQYCCSGRIRAFLLKFKISLAIILLHPFLATSDISNGVTSRSSAAKSSGIISATTSDTSSAARTLSVLPKPNHTETTNIPEFNFSTTVAESSIITFINYPINASDGASLEPSTEETTNILESNFSTTVGKLSANIIFNETDSATPPTNANTDGSQIPWTLESIAATTRMGKDPLTQEDGIFNGTDSVTLPPTASTDGSQIPWTLESIAATTRMGKDPLTKEDGIFNGTDSVTLPPTASTDGISHCKNDTKLSGNNLHNLSAICGDSVFYMGCVTFMFHAKSNNTSGNYEIIDNVTSSNNVSEVIPFTTSTPQVSKISEFNKTLQEQSESSFLECAVDEQSTSVCKFIIKLNKTANMSNVIAFLKDSIQEDQIELFCSSILSSYLTAEELSRLQCDGQYTVVCAATSQAGSLGSASSSTEVSNAVQPPTFTTVFIPHLSTKRSTTNLLTILTTMHSTTTTIIPAMPFTSSITQAPPSTHTTTVPPATSSPPHTSRIYSAMPFTTSLPKSTTISFPASIPNLVVSSAIPSIKTTRVAPIPSTKPTIIAPSGIHSTTDSQATGTNSTRGAILDNLFTINESEVESIISKLESALSAQKIEPNIAKEMVNTINNLLNAPSLVVAPLSNRIIKIVDAIGLKLNFATQSINITSPALAIAVTKVNSSSFGKMSFAVQDSSDLQIALGTQAPINSVGAIELPSSLLANLTSEDMHLASRIIFNFFEKTSPFQDPSLKEVSLISNVISSSVANLTLSDLQANVTVTLQNTLPDLDNLTVRCAFWDFNENGGNGGWSSEGCMVKKRRANETICTCNHLTSFGVLLDLSRSTTLPPIPALVLTFITYIGCGLSAIFLSITLVTYVAFEKIRRDYPSKILIQLCAALLLLNLVFLLDSWIALYNIQGLCITVAVFLHYFLLVSFTWMGLEAFHMYLALVKVFNTYVRKYILKFCIVGWGVPLLVVIIVLAITPNNYGLGSYGKFPNGSLDEFCWINNNTVFYITVVGYFCVVFLLNVSMFIVVLIQLCRIKKKKQLGTQRKTSIQDLRSVAGLTFLLGITWGFALFAWGPVNLVFMYLFAIFNTLQGFFIFIFYCVAKENVRKQWRRYLCCGRFRLAENSDWSRTATNGLKKQTVNQGVSSSSNSLQSNSNSTNSTTLLVNNDYSVHTNGNGYVSSEKNGVSFSVQNGDVCLHDFSGKQLIFHEKNGADHKKTRISLRRTSKRGSLNFIKQM
ncbi:adhesion G-protein coupled receptor G2 [Carettochelys insculpta]|uniref:adhesion G-protein coupled receptor G2 n=1 Tax=Carettochelys insculpta TaxID=44489 RepID=UPI003EC13309